MSDIREGKIEPAYNRLLISRGGKRPEVIPKAGFQVIVSEEEIDKNDRPGNQQEGPKPGEDGILLANTFNPSVPLQLF